MYHYQFIRFVLYFVQSAKQGRRAQASASKSINPPDAPAFEGTAQGSPQVTKSRRGAAQQDDVSDIYQLIVFCIGIDKLD